MDKRIERALDALRNSGWTIHTSNTKLDWWIDEAYELYSTWSPIGVKIYLTLDVDPYTTSNRRKGEGIISISLSKNIPESRLSTNKVTFYLSTLNDKGINQLIESSNDLRNEIRRSGS